MRGSRGRGGAFESGILFRSKPKQQAPQGRLSFNDRAKVKAKNILFERIKAHPDLENVYIHRWLGVDMPTDATATETKGKLQEAFLV